MFKCVNAKQNMEDRKGSLEIFQILNQKWFDKVLLFRPSIFPGNSKYDLSKAETRPSAQIPF